MENASKAFILAGSILIAIMLVSLGVLLFNNMGGAAKESVNMDQQEISNFNSKITPYFGKSIAGSQVNALLQYCLSVNRSANSSGETYKCITVKLNTGTVLVTNTSTTYQKVETGGKFYEVTGNVSSDGLYTTITVTPK